MGFRIQDSGFTIHDSGVVPRCCPDDGAHKLLNIVGARLFRLVLLDEGEPGRVSGSVIGVEERGKRMDGLDEGGGGEVERGKEEERWRLRHGTEIDSV